MTELALRRGVTPAQRRPAEPDEPVEFGSGLRARLETAGVIGGDGTAMVRLALQRKLLSALPELAELRRVSPSRLRVPHIPLATLAYQARLVPADRLEAALVEAERSNEPVGRVLARTGMLSERDVERLLAEQRGLAFVRVRDVELDDRLREVLPARTAAVFGAVPLGYVDGAPVVAVCDPTDDVAMESVETEVGEEVLFVAAPREDLGIARRRLYAPAEVAA